MEKVNWKRLIPGCFASETAQFGIHPCDGKRAKEMFHKAMRDGARPEDILVEVERYLKSRGVNENDVNEELTLIKRFAANPMKKTKMKSAWLITKEGTEISGEVVAILNYRKSADYVRELIENLYIRENYSLHEKFTYARSRKNNPYPAEFVRFNDARWLNCITCGHNPYLLARLVHDLVIIADDLGNDRLEWKEIPIPKEKQ